MMDEEGFWRWCAVLQRRAAMVLGVDGRWREGRSGRFFSIMSNLALDLIFNAVLAVEDVSFVKVVERNLSFSKLSDF